MQAVHLPGVPWFASLPIPGILLGMGDCEKLLKQVMSVVRRAFWPPRKQLVPLKKLVRPLLLLCQTCMR